MHTRDAQRIHNPNRSRSSTPTTATRRRPPILKKLPTTMLDFEGVPDETYYGPNVRNPPKNFTAEQAAAMDRGVHPDVPYLNNAVGYLIDPLSTVVSSNELTLVSPYAEPGTVSRSSILELDMALPSGTMGLNGIVYGDLASQTGNLLAQFVAISSAGVVLAEYDLPIEFDLSLTSLTSTQFGGLVRFFTGASDLTANGVYSAVHVSDLYALQGGTGNIDSVTGDHSYIANLTPGGLTKVRTFAQMTRGTIQDHGVDLRFQPGVFCKTTSAADGEFAFDNPQFYKYSFLTSGMVRNTNNFPLNFFSLPANSTTTPTMFQAMKQVAGPNLPLPSGPKMRITGKLNVNLGNPATQTSYTPWVTGIRLDGSHMPPVKGAIVFVTGFTPANTAVATDFVIDVNFRRLVSGYLVYFVFDVDNYQGNTKNTCILELHEVVIMEDRVLTGQMQNTFMISMTAQSTVTQPMQINVTGTTAMQFTPNPLDPNMALYRASATDPVGDLGELSGIIETIGRVLGKARPLSAYDRDVQRYQLMMSPEFEKAFSLGSMFKDVVGYLKPANEALQAVASVVPWKPLQIAAAVANPAMQVLETIDDAWAAAELSEEDELILPSSTHELAACLPYDPRLDPNLETASDLSGEWSKLGSSAAPEDDTEAESQVDLKGVRVVGMGHFISTRGGQAVRRTIIVSLNNVPDKFYGFFEGTRIDANLLDISVDALKYLTLLKRAYNSSSIYVTLLSRFPVAQRSWELCLGLSTLFLDEVATGTLQGGTDIYNGDALVGAQFKVGAVGKIPEKLNEFPRAYFPASNGSQLGPNSLSSFRIDFSPTRTVPVFTYNMHGMKKSKVQVVGHLDTGLVLDFPEDDADGDWEAAADSPSARLTFYLSDLAAQLGLAREFEAADDCIDGIVDFAVNLNVEKVARYNAGKAIEDQKAYPSEIQIQEKVVRAIWEAVIGQAEDLGQKDAKVIRQRKLTAESAIKAWEPVFSKLGLGFNVFEQQFTDRLSDITDLEGLTAFLGRFKGPNTDVNSLPRGTWKGKLPSFDTLFEAMKLGDAGFFRTHTESVVVEPQTKQPPKKKTPRAPRARPNAEREATLE